MVLVNLLIFIYFAGKMGAHKLIIFYVIVLCRQLAMTLTMMNTTGMEVPPSVHLFYYAGFAFN
jgi:hypothetical protein